MISLEQYKKSIDSFSQMDLSSSWVSFSKAEVVAKGRIYEVFLPHIKQKPNKLIRLIQRILCFICRIPRHLHTVKNLSFLLMNASQILSKDPSGQELIAKTSNVAHEILKKNRENLSKS